jgi:hypothetical protein
MDRHQHGTRLGEGHHRFYSLGYIVDEEMSSYQGMARLAQLTPHLNTTAVTCDKCSSICP